MPRPGAVRPARPARRRTRAGHRPGRIARHTRPLLALLALAVLALPAAMLTPSVARAGSVETGETTVTTADPTSISFSMRVQTSAGLEAATFRYTVINPDGNVGGSGGANFAPGNETDVTFTLETRTPQRYIPVGSEIAFRWELRDRDGDTVTTDEERYVFMDGRYQWQSRTENGVTVFWYGDNDENATVALTATRTAITEAEALLDTEVPYPVKVVVWRSEQEGALAMRPRAETFDQQVMTGGQRVAPDLLFVLAPQVDVIRHEAAHIVTHVAGDGPFSSIPSWLDEGTAVYMQRNPGGGYRQGLDFAIQSNTVRSLRSMQSPSNNPEQINAFYGQSWSTVSFMIEQYGEERFAELFRLTHAGTRIDDALMEVYGVDQDGLYNLWREANGLEPIEVSSPSGGQSTPGAQGTRTPFTIPTPIVRGGSDDRGDTEGGAEPETTDTTETAGSGGGDSTAMTAIIVGGGTVLLAVVLGGGAMYLLRRTE